MFDRIGKFLLILTALFPVILYLIERHHLFGLNMPSPSIWSVGVVFYGASIIAQYLGKREILIGVGLRVKEGEYDQLHRLIGLAFGLVLIGSVAIGLWLNR
ncbi:MAG: hypothetical protein HYX42_22460 [Polaromonas sp.]|uniref:hypothetical protein n=1 Tax=Polaromonas sp. TaxID=1869339 RepID=UPI0025DD0E18|nr:hypothetical protein [Polaromonas sp.]MBI2729010.1 hypothetical protein [Polaromonas sp.]